MGLANNNSASTALIAVICFAVASTASAVPPDGTESSTLFCGEFDQVDAVLNGYGIRVGDPFLGTLRLTQRAPDVPGVVTSWTCASPGAECGEMEIEIPGFVPPQTAPNAALLLGPASSISQSIVSYNQIASLDGFVVGATGSAELNILCSGCPSSNDRLDIKPNFTEFMESAGDLMIALQVPGIGGSAGTPAHLTGNVLEIGGLCRNHLPASSPWGLAVLALFLIAAAVVFAGGRLLRVRG